MFRVASRACLLLVLVSSSAAGAGAATLQSSLTVSAASDYYQRGISQTDHDPALQAQLSLAHPSGWFGSLFASTLALDDDAAGPRGDVELDAALGYGQELGNGFALIGRAARYQYFGDGTYGYNEATLGVQRGGVAASLSWSDRASQYWGDSLISELSVRHPLPRRFGLDVGAGWYDFDRYPGHAFWHAAVTYSYQRFDYRLGFYGGDETAREQFGDRAEGRLVANVSFKVR